MQHHANMLQFHLAVITYAIYSLHMHSCSATPCSSNFQIAHQGLIPVGHFRHSAVLPRTSVVSILPSPFGDLLLCPRVRCLLGVSLFPTSHCLAMQNDYGPLMFC